MRKLLGMALLVPWLAAAAPPNVVPPPVAVRSFVLVDALSGQTLAAAMEKLEAGDVVAGPVYDIRDIMDDPHYKAREDIIEVEDPNLGSIRMPGVMPKFSRTPGAVRHPGKPLGADNEWFYLEQLGLAPEELAALKEERVV